jgi:peroxiredoxin
MNTMKSILCFLIAALVAFAAKAQSDTTHKMLYPDSQTVFLNEKGDTLQSADFMSTLMGGGFTMVPTIENGRIKNLTLKANGVNLSEGRIPPDFTVSDLNGKAYHLSALKGKVVVLNFWFTHCAGCIAEMPELNELYQKYQGDTNLVFLAITFDDLPKVRDFLRTHTFSYSIVADQGEVVKHYGISTFPFSMVVDKGNRIVFSNNAVLQGKVVETLSKYIDQSNAE